MLKASFKKYILEFKLPAGTSRGILKTKEAWFILLHNNGKFGIGECGMLRGLSIDDCPDYESKLQWVCDNISLGLENLYNEVVEFPSIQMGLETAFKSLVAENPFQIFPSSFSKGEASIPINGLVWMGDKAFMKKQIYEKLKMGFRCIKMKIGSIDFKTELELLHSLRKEFSPDDIELRVDANGAFAVEDAMEKLKWLSELQLHSIEQPIAKGQWVQMARLCEQTPLPIALDEELIGIFNSEEKVRLVETVKPQFIILKPSFIGGFKGSDDWASIADAHGVGWWVTSALESNVGLNAISQYTFTKNSKLPQVLGTGSLFTNNIDSPLKVRNGSIEYDTNVPWNMDLLNFNNITGCL
ncbi:MAG: o-succinylbenzoate synthase [Flavobacteriaceae bacterium]|nr:o-succinylbenzoate synthase [Flavobacteriaceae bacterium]